MLITKTNPSYPYFRIYVLLSKHDKEPFFFFFTLDSIHRMPQTFIIQQNILLFAMFYSCNKIFIHTLCFFMLTTITYQKKNIFGFNQTNFSIAISPVSYSILPTTNFFESA